VSVSGHLVYIDGGVLCCCVGCSSFDAVLELLSVARVSLNEILSAFEFIDAAAMSCVTAHLRVSNPLCPSSFYVLLETSGSSVDHDEQKLQSFLDRAMSAELVTDGTIATVPSKIKVLSCRLLLKMIIYFYRKAVFVAIAVVSLLRPLKKIVGQLIDRLID